MWGEQQGQASNNSAGLYSVGSILNNGRYRVLKRLNKGATAIVYAAEDLLSGRPVALKVVQCGSNKVPVNVVRREVTLSSSVAHENMVQLLDVFAKGTELIIVWELISGCDLLELLNKCNGCMTEPAAAFYYVQLLRGVLHMHAMGYCHRDVKPENCMVEFSTQRLKLIDFGLSKHLESVATLGVGTPDYMPPEMVRSQIKQQQQHGQPLPQQPSSLPYDAKAVDAWAMGVLLYLLVTGCYPFEDPRQPNNLAATILNVQAGRCQPLPEHISPGCRAVITGLLCPDPAQRTRLEDLACNPWLLQAAAAHAVKLGAIGTLFDPSNPAWILPAVHPQAAAPTAAAATSPINGSSTAGAAAGNGSPVLGTAPQGQAPQLVGGAGQPGGAQKLHHSSLHHVGQMQQGQSSLAQQHQHHLLQQQPAAAMCSMGNPGSAVGLLPLPPSPPQLQQQQQLQRPVLPAQSHNSSSGSDPTSGAATIWHSFTSVTSGGDHVVPPFQPQQQQQHPSATGATAAAAARNFTAVAQPPAAAAASGADPISKAWGTAAALAGIKGYHHQQQQQGQGEDAMDMDVDWTEQDSLAAAAATTSTVGGVQREVQLDQGALGGAAGGDARERRGGLNWLQSLVRKRG